MAEKYKILAQSHPFATILTDIYTVPALTSAIISTILITNQSSVDTSFRLSLAVAGAVDDPKQYIAYDVPLLGNETKAFTVGITLSTTDVIRAYPTLATISFTVCGTEVT